VCARLLILADPLPVSDVDGALPRTRAAGLVRLGLARVEGASVIPTALVHPQAFVDEHGAGEWWIASDLDETALRGELPDDHVLGVGGASMTLAGLQLPAAAGRVWDLGSGCGIQSLRARRYADTVVATDLSARALDFTRFNAALNGIDGVDVRLGSMFDPVRGETFDRVVSNPPFVITPRTADVPSYEYRDGGLEGDAIVADLVRGVGGVLRPGGIAQFLGNWEYHAEASGPERIASWIAASDVRLDWWVIEREQLDPLSYAAMWIRDGGTLPGTDAYDRLLSAWLEDFAARGVTSVGFGYVLLRRPEGAPTLERFERLPQPVVEGNLGGHIARVLDAHDAVAALSDAELSASTFLVASDVTEARHHRPGEADPTVIELRQGGGFSRVRSVDPALAAFVGACDGDLPAGALMSAIAQLLDADEDALTAQLITDVRDLVLEGFLTLV